MITSINQVKTIIKRLDVNSSSSIYELFNFEDFTSNSYSVVSENIFIKNLRAYAVIKSVASSSLPDFGLEDTETDKLSKALNIEWNSERKQLDLYISSQTPVDWFQVGSVSLLNPSGYPYRIYNIMDILTNNLAVELGSGGKIGVAIKDAGYGLLAGNDIVTIHGSCVRELILEDSPNIASSVPFSVNIAETSVIVREADTNRKNLILINNSESGKVFINFDVTATLNQGIVLLPGGSYEINTHEVRYFGAISAIAEDSVQLTGIETF